MMSGRALHAVGRVRILAELHWALPRPLSRAELALRDAALPDGEAAQRELQHAAQARTHALPILAPKEWLSKGSICSSRLQG
jgi:hypothetical protein